MSEQPHICVRKGEVLTCELGHEICEAIEDIHFGQLGWHRSLGKWRQDVPEEGESLPRCEVCGGEVFGPFVGYAYIGGEKRIFYAPPAGRAT